MTATITADRLEAYLNEKDSSKKTWMRDFLGDLPEDPRIDDGLLRTLVHIAEKASYTRYNDDYDSSPDGISLSSLTPHRQRVGAETIDLVLNEFLYRGNTFTTDYVIEYIGQSRHESMIPFLQEVMERCCKYPSSPLACKSKKALESIGTEDSRRVLAERGECNCWNHRSR